MKKTILLIGLGLMIVVTSCKKEVTGPKGDQGAQGIQGVQGPEAQTETFTLQFNSGDTYKSYSPNFSNYKSTDVILIFVLSANYGGTDFYVQTPFVTSGINFYGEFSENTGQIFINTVYADGTAGSPWTSSQTFGFKAVHISSKMYQMHPNVDHSNYLEVKKAYNLK
jgi:hypothetical protein